MNIVLCIYVLLNVYYSTLFHNSTLVKFFQFSVLNFTVISLLTCPLSFVMICRTQIQKERKKESRTLNNAENYPTIEKELLATVWACKYFRQYLYGRKFTIVTDHRLFTWIFSVKDPSSRLLRWRLKLEEYEYAVKYKKGPSNTNADALSSSRSFCAPGFEVCCPLSFP